jgi:hypothetical protein
MHGGMDTVNQPTFYATHRARHNYRPQSSIFNLQFSI